MLKAHIISSSSDGASDSGWGKNLLRVEVNGRTVYLEHNYNWHLQSGAENSHSSSDEYKVVSVDEEPFRKTDLPEAAQAFLEQFAKNEFQGNPALKIKQNIRGTFVEGVDGFTKLAPTPVPNPVL